MLFLYSFEIVKKRHENLKILTIFPIIWFGWIYKKSLENQDNDNDDIESDESDFKRISEEKNTKYFMKINFD